MDKIYVLRDYKTLEDVVNNIECLEVVSEDKHFLYINDCTITELMKSSIQEGFVIIEGNTIILGASKYGLLNKLANVLEIEISFLKLPRHTILDELESPDEYSQRSLKLDEKVILRAEIEKLIRQIEDYEDGIINNIKFEEDN